MNADEAKEILKLTDDGHGFLTRNHAKGYLEALEGEEVKVLLEALSTIADFKAPHLMNIDKVLWLREKAEEALAQFQEAAKK